MFLTITINTTRKKKPLVKMHQRKLDPKRGWHKLPRIKKRGIIQRLKAWKRSLGSHSYRFGHQQFVR